MNAHDRRPFLSYHGGGCRFAVVPGVVSVGGVVYTDVERYDRNEGQAAVVAAAPVFVVGGGAGSEGEQREAGQKIADRFFHIRKVGWSFMRFFIRRGGCRIPAAAYGSGQ